LIICRDEKGFFFYSATVYYGSYYHNPGADDIKAFKVFSKKEIIGYGCEICLAADLQPLSPEAVAMSVWDI